MKTAYRKLLFPVAAAGLLATGFATAAVAVSGSLSLRTSSANEGSFTGTFRLVTLSPFRVTGTVCDNRADGNTVYGQARVDGYAWSSKVTDSNGSAAGCGSENRTFKGDDFPVRGQYQVCVDDIGSDTCGTSQWIYVN
jgi:hypothetical protein